MVKKNELFLIAGVLLVAALVFVWNRLESAGLARADARVQVTVNGEQRLLLPGGALGRYEIAERAGQRNVVEILGEGVRVAEANCPDHWCVRKGIVPRGADIIVCLPHRLIVRWVGPDGSPGGFDDVDVVAQ
ncbi:MAG: NusG domain II-containing protein [Clostridia bacterium]|nr:NusG domain II-containing protein [Clostridia bacterium]